MMVYGSTKIGHTLNVDFLINFHKSKDDNKRKLVLRITFICTYI